MKKIDSSDLIRLHRAMARIVAHLAGSDELQVWASYGMFEDDMSTLVDVMGVLEDTAKPCLEERERMMAVITGRSRSDHAKERAD